MSDDEVIFTYSKPVERKTLKNKKLIIDLTIDDNNERSRLAPKRTGKLETTPASGQNAASISPNPNAYRDAPANSFPDKHRKLQGREPQNYSSRTSPKPNKSNYTTKPQIMGNIISNQSVPDHSSRTSLKLTESSSTTIPSNKSLIPKKSLVNETNEPNFIVRADGLVSEKATSVADEDEMAKDQGLLNNDEFTESNSVESAVLEPLALDIETVKKLVRKHQDLLQKSQEDMVRLELRKARDQARSLDRGPLLDRSLPDPFSKLSFLPSLASVPHQSLAKGQTPDILPMTVSDVHQSQGPKLQYFNTKDYFSGAEHIPRVKSIGRLGGSHATLSKNVKLIAFTPYYPENELATQAQKDLYGEFYERYLNDIEKRSSKRHCREIAAMWRPQLECLLRKHDLSYEDIFYYMLHEDEEEQPIGILSEEAMKVWNDRSEGCPKCQDDPNEDCRGSNWRKIARLVKRSLTEHRLALAGLLCAAFYEIVGINIWHVISDTQSARKYREGLLQRDRKPARNVCYICASIDCPSHGAYESCYNEEQDESDPEVMLDDDEIANNFRRFTLSEKQHTSNHICGTYCLELNATKMLGLHRDGSVSGDARWEFMDKQLPVNNDNSLDEDDDNHYNDEEPCDSDVCFWKVDNRLQSDVENISNYIREHKLRALFDSEGDTLRFKNLVSHYRKHKRGPCIIAMLLGDHTPCRTIFYALLYEMKVTPHPDERSLQDLGPKTVIKFLAPDLSRDKILLNRRAFFPCSHLGSCLDNPACTCSVDKVSCEPNCCCEEACTRRFRGCKCQRMRRKYCFEDKSCECWQKNRECNPLLCGDCGVEDVLDNANRDNKIYHRKYCKNNRVQLGIPKRLIMGQSQVHGWGLYAGENIAQFEFVAEYKGELISIAEGNRRGTIYHNLGQEYLFKMSKDQELDGSRISNKARFINNSEREANINLEPKHILCNGIIRIMLYAKKQILAGEELFYCYGYEKEITKKFKEKPIAMGKALYKQAQLLNPAVEGRDTFQDDSEGENLTAEEPDALEISPSDPESDFNTDKEPSEELTGEEEEDDEEEDEGQELLDSQSSGSDVQMNEKRDILLQKSILIPAKLGGLQRQPSVLQHRKSLRPPEWASSFRSRHSGREDLYKLPTRSDFSRPPEKKKPRLSMTSRNLTEIFKGTTVEDESSSDSDLPISIRRRSATQSNDNSEDSGDSDSKHLSKRRDSSTSKTRKRRIYSTDRRFGGEAQRKAAQTRKANLAVMIPKADAKRKRSEMAEKKPSLLAGDQKLTLRVPLSQQQGDTTSQGSMGVEDDGSGPVSWSSGGVSRGNLRKDAGGSTTSPASRGMESMGSTLESGMSLSGRPMREGAAVPGRWRKKP